VAPVIVTFDEALGLAARAPAVVGAEEAAAAQRRLSDSTSSMIANPTLNLQPGAARDPVSGDWAFIAEATAIQGWNLSGLPGDRRDALRAQGEQFSAEARASALSHRLAAAQTWIELWAVQRALFDARQEAEISREFATRMARAAEGGVMTRAEAADARTYYAEAHVLAITVEGEWVDKGFALAGAMGVPAPEPMQSGGSLPKPPMPPQASWPELLAAADRMPAVAARRLSADAGRFREQEARSMKGWGLGTGVKATRDFLGTWGVQGVVEVAFPLFDRGEREAAPEAAVAARAQGEYAEARAAAATELARALHEVEHTGEILETVEQELLPAAEEGAKLREATMRAAETTVLEVLVARRAWAAARAKHTRAQAAHAWARVKVWLLLSDLSNGGSR
jgi:cobalt-zinc-cadmium efflux system outer membrane protein